MTDKLEPFEGMAFYRPAEGEDSPAAILVEPTVLLARDVTEARMLVGRKVAEDWFSKPGRVEVRARPFRG